MKLCSELKFCDSYFITLEDIVHFIFFSKPFELLFIFFLFSGFLGISLLLLYHFLNEVYFLKDI